MTDDIARSTVARGNNFVLYAPPSPAAAGSTLLGIAERDGPSLGLIPVDALGEWARVAGHLAGSSNVVRVTTSPDRLPRLLAATPGVTLTTPETVLESVRRSGLKLGEVAGVLIVWPERWADEDDQLATLLQDVSKEAQRVIVTSDPQTAAPLVDRYAWRAAIGDLLGEMGEPATATVQITPVSWAGRIESVADIIEQLDPTSLTVWTSSALDHQAIREMLATSGVDARVINATPSASRIIIAYDLPTPGQLRELIDAGDVILLAPAGTERYVAQLVPRRKPLHLRGALARARNAAEKIRREILEALERGTPSSSLEILAPVFERHEATAVAGTILSLWQRDRTQSPVGPPARMEESSVRIWVSAGKRDGVTPNDLVAVLAKDCQVPREAIGRIEIRDSFSLVDIARSAEPEQVAERLTGKTVRKRRLVARLDRPSAPLVQRVSKRLPGPKHRGSA